MHNENDVMEIRKTSQRDTSGVINLFIKIFAEPPYREKWQKKDVLKRFSQFPRMKEFSFVAEEKGRIIGFIVSQAETWDDGVHIFIQDAGVDSHYRRKGVASAIVAALEEACRKRGVKAVNLFTNVYSTGVPFWRRLGYHRTKYIHLEKKL